MELGLGHYHHCEEKLELVLTIGGATETIFPKVELLLREDDYMEALEFVASRKNMHRYYSVMDFLFCELHPEWIPSCKRFYAGKGPLLKEQITDEQIDAYQERLLKALSVARDLFREARCRSWGWYREQVEVAIKEAA